MRANRDIGRRAPRPSSRSVRPAGHAGRPTVHDVAARAGVSIATVSRVLNGSSLASPKAVAAVTRAVTALGFRPNGIGRQLKTARTRTIGVLVPSLANPVFAESVAGIESAANAAGYSVVLAGSSYDAASEANAVETLLANRVDGLILTVANAEHSSTIDLLQREGVPFVLIYNQPRRKDVIAISVDNVAAARDITRALIAAGHRRLAMIAGDLSASDRSALRHRGFQRALAEAGLPKGPLIEVNFHDTRLPPVFRDLFGSETAPTALFCSTDLLAIAAMRGVRDLGLRVPEDVAIAGFDGITVGELIAPSLATVVQPTHAMGQTAVNQLLAGLDGGASPRSITLPHVLRPGESLGSARAQARCLSPATGEQRSERPC